VKASDYIAWYLEARGVHCVFEMSGGMITHLLDSIHRLTSLRIVSMHHEQAAAFAADAVGRLTGVPGVALATSGPGATNLLTGIGSCYFDSSPAVFITGAVNRNEQKGERQIRQLGFQETDVVAMARPITKAAWMVESPEDLPAALDKAFAIATEGRRGPVLLDLPMDLQRADVAPPEFGKETPTPSPDGTLEDEGFWEELFGALEAARKPLILVGGGVPSSGTIGPFREFLRRLRVPVVTSLMAVDAITYDDPLRAGWIGSYGNRWANLAIGESDFILVLGSRLDIRQTGADTEGFKAGKAIIHVDCEPGEINNRVTGCRAVVAGLPEFFDAALKRARGREFEEKPGWLEEISALRRAWPDTKELEGVPGINPNRFMHRLSAHSGEAAAYVVDVGQHQMWAAQSLELGPDQRFLTSGGMGSMGFSLPAAVGTAFVEAGRPIVLIAGDGCFQTNIQELQTVVRNRLPIKLVVVDNGCHGMVRQFQQSYFDERYQSTLWGYDTPDFAKVAEAYGVSGRTVEDEGEVEDALRWLWSDPFEPALLRVMVDTYANAYPKIAFGKPITQMEPFAKPQGMDGGAPEEAAMEGT
jgi:acetolactate synthase-1/2/3 large subunit